VKATQTLPPTYFPYNNLSPTKLRKTYWVTYIFGIALAWLSFRFLRLIAEILRPDFQPRPLHFEVPTLERLGSMLVTLFVLAVVVAIHEFIHVIFLWFFTGHRPIIVAGGGNLAVRLPSWYIPRNKFLVINLAPFCIIGLVGLLLLLVVPQRYISLTVFLTAMSVGCSIADITSSAYLFLHPPSVYLETDGTLYFDEHIGPNLVPEWKLRTRYLIEATIDKLDPINRAG
jgi:hypothetical protein